MVICHFTCCKLSNCNTLRPQLRSQHTAEFRVKNNCHTKNMQFKQQIASKEKGRHSIMCANEFQLYFSHDKLYVLISARLEKNLYHGMFLFSNAFTSLILQFLLICSFSVIIKMLFLKCAYSSSLFHTIKNPQQNKSKYNILGER